MQFLNDARFVLFANPADTFPAESETPELPTRDDADAILASDAEYQEYQDRLDAEMHAELDAHLDKMYAEHCELQNGKIAIESDALDAEVQRCD